MPFLDVVHATATVNAVAPITRFGVDEQVFTQVVVTPQSLPSGNFTSHLRCEKR